MIALLNEFFSVSGIPRRTVLLLALAGIVGGASNAALLAIVGETLRHNFDWQTSYGPWLFALATVLYLSLYRYSHARTARVSERAGARMRLRILDAAFHATLADSERVEPHFKRLVLTRDTAQVAAALPNIVALCSSLATVICALGYMFWISPLAAAATGVITIAAVLAYQAMIGRTRKRLNAAYAEHDHAFGFVDDLLQGHKELKLDVAWAREFIGGDLEPSVEHAAKLLGEVRAAQQDVSLIGIIAFVVLLGSATFLSPVFGIAGGVVVNALLVLLFVQAHIHSIVQRLPGLLEMRQSAQRIRQLLADLARRDDVSVGEADGVGDWRCLSLRGLGFVYPGVTGEKGFQIHGIDLTVMRGQTVFIVGGNGSGKTTLAKLLVGLYPPSEGAIFLDDTEIVDANRTGYRQQFNAVFSDVHLFRRRVSGTLADPASEVRTALADMSINLAVSADSRLAVKPFSQGQRKRLASALALASEKPMCLFDEWTADQDPEFRSYFYHRYLPRLKAAGKTLFVITHDDRYFHHADVIVRMEGGAVVSTDAPVEPAYGTGSV